MANNRDRYAELGRYDEKEAYFNTEILKSSPSQKAEKKRQNHEIITSKSKKRKKRN